MSSDTAPQGVLAEFTALRDTSAKAFMFGLCAQLPLAGALGYACGTFSLGLFILVTLATGGAAGLLQFRPGQRLNRNVIAVVLMMQVSMLVFFAPPAWRIDMHMYYFAALAMLCVFADWRPILAAAAFVAVHHIALNFFYPIGLFGTDGDFARVVLHAVILALETAALYWLCKKMGSLLAVADHSVKEARNALDKQREADETANALKRDDAARQAALAEKERQADAEKAQLELEAQDRASKARAASRAELADTFQSNVASIVAQIQTQAAGTQSAAQTVEGSVFALDGQLEEIDTNAHKTSETVSALAGAAEELSVSFEDISSQIDRSSQVVVEASKAAEKTDQTISDLNVSAARISEIVDTIQSIADQTNLLALNATIEAARAGDAGKGFAVVASEVKALANQTAKATEEVTGQVQTIQQQVGTTVEEIQAIRTTFARVNEISESIASSIAEQRRATSDIAKSVQFASSATQSVSSAVMQSGSYSTDCKGSAEEMKQAIDHLIANMNDLNVSMESFLGGLKAA